jgi:hypothetical protein
MRPRPCSRSMVCFDLERASWCLCRREHSSQSTHKSALQVGQGVFAGFTHVSRAAMTRGTSAGNSCSSSVAAPLPCCAIRTPDWPAAKLLAGCSSAESLGSEAAASFAAALRSPTDAFSRSSGSAKPTTSQQGSMRQSTASHRTFEPSTQASSVGSNPAAAAAAAAAAAPTGALVLTHHHPRKPPARRPPQRASSLLRLEPRRCNGNDSGLTSSAAAAGIARRAGNTSSANDIASSVAKPTVCSQRRAVRTTVRFPSISRAPRRLAPAGSFRVGVHAARLSSNNSLPCIGTRW